MCGFVLDYSQENDYNVFNMNKYANKLKKVAFGIGVCLVCVGSFWLIRDAVVRAQASEVFRTLQAEAAVITPEPILETGASNEEQPEEQENLHALVEALERNAEERTNGKAAQSSVREVSEASGAEYDVPAKLLDWDALHTTNKDIYAWITVPGTIVDYPIVQHPKKNAWYLNHNLDGTKGYPACIYTENYNRKDFTDRNTVIYGHNLKDGTMFSSLHNFEDAEFFAEEHYIYVYTQERTLVYRVFAAYEFPAIHLLLNFDLKNDYTYEQYLKDISAGKGRIANIREDIEVTTGDQIITLSTCTSDHNADYRYLVAGVLVKSYEAAPTVGLAEN